MTRQSVAVLFVALFTSSSYAGLVLTFQVSGPTTVPIGDVIDVEVLLTQTTPIAAHPDITSDGLQTFAVPLTVTGDLTAFDVRASAAFGADVSDPVIQTPLTGVSFPSPRIAAFSIGPAVTGNPISLGTFQYTATSAGTVMMTPTDFGNTFAFGAGTPGEFDAEVFSPAPTLSITAVPEPSAFLFLGLMGFMAAAKKYIRNRRAS